MSKTFDIAPARPDQYAFVAKALKEHLRHSSNEIGTPPKALKDLANFEAYRFLNPYINDLLPKCDVLVASRGTYYLGFVMFQDVDGICLAHVYVRGDERKKNVAKALLASAFERINPDSTLESFFPTERWQAKAEAYGFYCPESL